MPDSLPSKCLVGSWPGHSILKYRPLNGFRRGVIAINYCNASATKNKCNAERQHFNSKRAFKTLL